VTSTIDRSHRSGDAAPVRSRRLGAPLQLSQRFRTKHYDSFAAAFWIGLSLHVLAAEWWIRTTPAKTG
jgi:hypothetical protein